MLTLFSRTKTWNWPLPTFQVSFLCRVFRGEELNTLLSAPAGFLHTMIGWYLQRADPVLARVWKVSTEKNTYDFVNWEAKKDAWIHEFHEKVSVLRLLLSYAK